MARWGAGVIGALVCAVGIAGCGGEPAPVVTDSLTATPTASASVSATPSPSATLTTAELLDLLPEGAKSADLDGAIKTAEFFVEQYGVMLQSGDTRLWDALSGPECEFCSESSAVAAGYVEAGTKVEGGDVRIDDTRTHARLNRDGFTYVGLVAHEDDVSLTKAGSAGPDVTVGQDTGLILKMALADDRWTVAGVQVVKPGEVS